MKQVIKSRKLCSKHSSKMSAMKRKCLIFRSRLQASIFPKAGPHREKLSTPSMEENQHPSIRYISPPPPGSATSSNTLPTRDFRSEKLWAKQARRQISQHQATPTTVIDSRWYINISEIMGSHFIRNIFVSRSVGPQKCTHKANIWIIYSDAFFFFLYFYLFHMCACEC